MQTVLAIIPKRSLMNRVVRCLDKYPDRFTLIAQADNSVVGMTLLEDLAPDYVIIVSYMPFWNAQDIINYAILRGNAPQFILLQNYKFSLAEEPEGNKRYVSAVLFGDSFTDSQLIQALSEPSGGERCQGGVSAQLPSSAELHPNIEHSMNTMAILMGLVSRSNSVAQAKYGRLNVGMDDCWIVLGHSGTRDDNFSFFQHPDNLERLFADIKEELESYGPLEVSIYREDNLCVLINGQQDNTPPDWKALCSRVNDCLERNHFERFFFEISDEPISFEEWNAHCQGLMELRNYRFFLGKSQSLQKVLIDQGRKPISQDEIKAKLSELMQGMQELKHQRMMDSLEALFALVNASLSFDAYFFMMSQLYKQYSYLLYAYNIVDNYEEYEQVSRNFATIDDAKRYILSMYDDLHQQLSNVSVTTNQLVLQMQTFIRENLDGELRLEQVASHVHASPTYLSRLFKKETGVSFSDFVNRQRVQRAKTMLETPCKIIDIANMVGFGNAKYFSQVFKRYTGMTPQKYREERRNANLS